MMGLTDLFGEKKTASWFLTLVIACLTSALLPARAAVLIWPTNIFIDSKEKGAALWLENRGETVQTYQMRLYAWSQNDGKDELGEQNGIVGSPPIMEIEPGKRQLIRLIRTRMPPPGTELTYRIILDEIPSVQAEEPDKANGVKFRMRYSIPVFVFGEGLSSQSLPGNEEQDTDKPLIASHLSWRIKNGSKQKMLEISNSGPVHVHLRNLTFAGTAGTETNPRGPAGYILPHTTMSWPVTSGMGSGPILLALVNGKQLIRINAANAEEAD